MLLFGPMGEAEIRAEVGKMRVRETEDTIGGGIDNGGGRGYEGEGVVGEVVQGEEKEWIMWDLVYATNHDNDKRHSVRLGEDRGSGLVGVEEDPNVRIEGNKDISPGSDT